MFQHFYEYILKKESQQRNKRYEENQMIILELKNIANIKKLIVWTQEQNIEGREKN